MILQTANRQADTPNLLTTCHATYEASQLCTSEDLRKWDTTQKRGGDRDKVAPWENIMPLENPERGSSPSLAPEGSTTRNDIHS